MREKWLKLITGPPNEETYDTAKTEAALPLTVATSGYNNRMTSSFLYPQPTRLSWGVALVRIACNFFIYILIYYIKTQVKTKLRRYALFFVFFFW